MYSLKFCFRGATFFGRGACRGQPAPHHAYSWIHHCSLTCLAPGQGAVRGFDLLFLGSETSNKLSYRTIIFLEFRSLYKLYYIIKLYIVISYILYNFYGICLDWADNK